MNYLLLPLLSKSAPGYSAQQIVLNFYFAKKEEEEEENNQRKSICVLSVFYIDRCSYIACKCRTIQKIKPSAYILSWSLTWSGPVAVLRLHYSSFLSI